MKLSVVIPCYNVDDTLGATLESLTRQDWDQPWEVVVVNNRSTDDTLAVAEQFKGRLPNLRLVEAAARQGRPYARNVGVAAARGEAIVFIDADDLAEQGWLRAMGEALAQHDFVACRIDDSLLNTPAQRAMRANNQRDGLQLYKNPPFHPHAAGGTIGIRRKLVQAVGGFDETMLFLQDTDLCWRVQIAGYPLQFVPEATVQMRYRAGYGAIFRQARNFGEYNWLLYRRYRPLGMPAITLWQEAAGWGKVARSLARVRGRASLGKFVWNLAWRLGRLQGIGKYGWDGPAPTRYANALRAPRLISGPS
jgi:glycosyltransferase involved in cell wall biosynthesis